MSQILDQSAHVAVAAVALLPAALWPCGTSFAFAGMMTGIVREVTEEGSPVTIARIRHALGGASWGDIAFWALGGFLTGQAAGS